MVQLYEIHTKDQDWKKYQDEGFWQVRASEIKNDYEFLMWARERASNRRYHALIIHDEQ